MIPSQLKIKFVNLEFWYLSLSFLINWLAFKLLFPFVPDFLLDFPNNRSSHTNPRPKVGGIIFVTSTVLFALIQKYQLILYCLPLAVVGLFDDIFSLPRIYRYLTQVLTATLILLHSNNVKSFLITNNFFNSSLLLIFLIFLTTAIINFSNFMDGLDGILATNFVICFLVMALTFNSNLYPLVGALLGFLIWNWYPSKLFMGDVGSTFLGTIFISSVIEAPKIVDSFGLLLVGTPIFADSFLCVLRRYFAGQNIFDSHKLHLYQRLNQAGLSHAKVTTIYSISTTFLALIYLTSNINLLIFSSILIVIFGFWLDKNVAKVFH